MITCPECSDLSYHGALFCRGCGAPLTPVAEAVLSARSREGDQAPGSPRVDAARRSLGVMSVRAGGPAADKPGTSRSSTRRFSLEQLASGGSARIICVTLGEETVRLPLAADGVLHIGRSDPAAGFVPDLDLDPYDGFEAGVSRRHATIHSCRQGVVLVDQGSSNGTWLDGRRLATGFAYLLQQTTDVKLGELVVQVTLED